MTISVGMTDKQVVWFMGFFCTSIFPRRIFFSIVIVNQLDLTSLSCVICSLLTFARLARNRDEFIHKFYTDCNVWFIPVINVNKLAEI